jgi:hypothetical protein
MKLISLIFECVAVIWFWRQSIVWLAHAFTWVHSVTQKGVHEIIHTRFYMMDLVGLVVLLVSIALMLAISVIAFEVLAPAVIQAWAELDKTFQLTARRREADWKAAFYSANKHMTRAEADAYLKNRQDERANLAKKV